MLTYKTWLSSLDKVIRNNLFPQPTPTMGYEEGILLVDMLQKWKIVFLWLPDH